MKFVGHTIRTTQVNIVRALLLTSYAASSREWGALVNRYDELDTDAVEEGPISPAQADDDLAQWLGNLDISEDATEENDGHDPCSYAGRRQWEQAITVEMGDHALYRCSWCGNPSAALRKCRSCGKTQYVSCNCVLSVLGYSTTISLSDTGTAMQGVRSRTGRCIRSIARDGEPILFL